jgi:uncharacterized protein (DUF2062 family)
MKEESVEKRRRRLRLSKKFLRRLPRRSQLARLPLVGKLISGAGRASFLWSFRRREVLAALLLGWIIALSPFFGVHTLLVVVCAFPFRANVLVALALQLVSTPLTIPFLWPILLVIGKWAVAAMAGNAVAQAHGGVVHSMALLALGGILAAYICTALSAAVCLLLFPGSPPGERRPRN